MMEMCFQSRNVIFNIFSLILVSAPTLIPCISFCTSLNYFLRFHKILQNILSPCHPRLSSLLHYIFVKSFIALNCSLLSIFQDPKFVWFTSAFSSKIPFGLSTPVSYLYLCWCRLYCFNQLPPHISYFYKNVFSSWKIFIFLLFIFLLFSFYLYFLTALCQLSNFSIKIVFTHAFKRRFYSIHFRFFYSISRFPCTVSSS